MLKVVEAVLAELELLPPHGLCGLHLNITTGESLAISAFVSERDFLQIKASEHRDLQSQYEAYGRAAQRFPAFVPRPLGYRRRDGWSVMVTTGVAHRMVQPGDIRLGWLGACAPLLRDALQFFAVAAARTAGANCCASPDHGALLDALVQHFAATPLTTQARRLVRSARDHGVEAWPRVAQHGDFVVNNLAYAGRHLVVFDWEDYAQITLPGLDLCTLIVSILEEDPQRLAGLMQLATGDAGLDAFVRAACAALGLEEAVFRCLLPFYLLVFLYLKRHYGAEVQQRICALVMRLCAVDGSGTERPRTSVAFVADPRARPGAAGDVDRITGRVGS